MLTTLRSSALHALRWTDLSALRARLLRALPADLLTTLGRTSLPALRRTELPALRSSVLRALPADLLPALSPSRPAPRRTDLPPLRPGLLAELRPTALRSRSLRLPATRPLTALLHTPHLSGLPITGLARLCRSLLPRVGLRTRLRVATVWSARFTLPRLLHRTLPAVLRPRRRSRMLRPHLLPTRRLWLLYAPHRRTRLHPVLLTARRLRPRRLRPRRLRPRRLRPRWLRPRRL
ncbi:hypothetical protein AB0L64_14085 [Kribbella sp. NPDC051936]|uniref:hypothetical protein n=1 Tax=Kribbella sp. NPDC051936 TaxID=3154946 RepID=UPI00342532C2